MRSEFLKIAGVKSEAEFYKKFPSEEAFMKKHGKAIKKLMAKKAQVGTMIPNIQTPEQNFQPIKFTEEYLHDVSANMMGGDTMQEIKDDAMYQSKITKLNEEPKENFIDKLSNIGETISQMDSKSAKNGGKFSPHMMYDLKTGKSKKANTYKEHLALKKKGWGHDAPKAQVGYATDGITPAGIHTPTIVDAQPTQPTMPNNQSNFMQGFNDFTKVAGPIAGDVMSIADQFKTQGNKLDQARQNRQLSDVTLQAFRTKPEEVQRQYSRPEDYSYTGETQFPVQGVGSTSISKHGGIYKAQEGGMFNGEYEPLINPNQQKQFKKGGFVWGGGQAGQAGTDFARMLGADSDAGSNVGSKVGGTLGTLIGGPVGGAIGGAIGTAAGGLLDTTDKKIAKQERFTNANTDEMMFGSVGPAIHSQNSAFAKNGVTKTVSNPSMLDTMAMGGELKSLWGGELETVSYNPYAGGESVEPKNANSHSYRDPKTGQTGQGIAYGNNAVNNNKASVEIESGEPMQKLNNGGEEENLVVFGDMYIPDNLISLIQDDRAKGKKFKTHVSNNLNKDEAKINKRQEKVAELGLVSDDTTFGKLEKNTADTVLRGSDMKLISIANQKNTLAELQNIMNETFDEYGIDANKFIKTNKMVKDPMRIENTEMAKYGKNIPKAQKSVTGNVKKDDFDKKPIPKTKMTEEELEENGYVQEGDSNVWIKTDGENVEAVEASGESLGYTPEGQSVNESGTYGNAKAEDIKSVLENNSWFKGGIDLGAELVIYKGKLINPDVLRFQQEFNERVKGTDIKPVKVDGKFGQETKTARYSAPVEGKKAVEEKVIMEQPTTTTKSTTLTPRSGFPISNFQRPIKDASLDPNQLLAEYYALATNKEQPVESQGFQPSLRVPYDISLQSAKNDIIAQSRAMQKNPVLQNNPAALALSQVPTYEALNKINESEFIANQQMKNMVYSGNIDKINQAKMTNLGIYDKQADRQAQAAANTRTQNIDTLSSISDKYSQNKRDNAINQVYANMYPTFRFNENYQTEVQQPTVFNMGQSSTEISPLNSINPSLQNKANVFKSLLGLFGKEKGKKEETSSAKYGKKVTKNNKNSNILKAIKNL